MNRIGLAQHPDLKNLIQGEVPPDVYYWNYRFNSLGEVHSLPDGSILFAVVLDFLQAKDFAEYFFSTNPTCYLFLNYTSFDLSSIQYILEKHTKVYFLDFSKSNDLRFVLDRTVFLREQAKNQRKTLDESRKQIRELEKLNLDLESLVQERSSIIEKSQKAEEEKLQKIRQLIRFIIEISGVQSLDELLLLLRKEFKKFSYVGLPIFVWQYSPSKTHVMSWRKDQLLERSSHRVFHFPEQFNIVDREMALQLADVLGRPMLNCMTLPVPMQLIHKSGLFDFRFCVVFEHSGSLQEIDFFLQELTERLQPIAMVIDRLLLESEIRSSNLRWETIFDQFPKPLAVIERNFEVVRANKAFYQHSKSGKCYQVFAGQNEPCENCPMTSDEDKLDVQIKIKEQLYQVYSGSIQNFVVHQYEDITQERDLYLKVLQTEKLGALGMLASHIAHELNNPLTGIQSLTEILISESDSKESQFSQDMLEIQNGAKRCQDIIRSLLDFTQTGSGQVAPQNTWEQLVTKTLPMVKALTRKHELILDLKTPDCYFVAEPQLLQQVLFNLIDNSSQAMSTSGKIILNSYLSSETNEAVLVIHDSGPGIPPELIDKVFEPFFTTKKEGLGTGLGLSLAKQVIQRYGGDIRFLPISSGAKVEIRMPITQVSKGAQ